MQLRLDYEKLREILADFYHVSRVRTVIFDNEFRRVMAYPEQNCDFCALMKENPDSRALCKENDRRACEECEKAGNLYIYRCHAGLFEAVAPIRMNDITLGYIMLGQIREKGEEDEAIACYARRYVTDEGALLAACRSLPRRSKTQIRALARIMEVCTCYLWIEKLIGVDEENLIFHLSNYINNNIRADLSVETLLSVFGISRSRLYDVSHKYYGMSIAHYIRRKRVYLARERLGAGARIAEAAEYAGFTDYNYFSKIFKAETGMTPSAYKRSCGQPHAEQEEP